MTNVDTKVLAKVGFVSEEVAIKLQQAKASSKYLSSVSVSSSMNY